MKPIINANRSIVQRHLWMMSMLSSLSGDECYRLNRIRRKGDALELFAIIDFGKALRSKGCDGVVTALVPDSATDDEAEAILLRFIDSLPEPKEPTWPSK